MRGSGGSWPYHLSPWCATHLDPCHPHRLYISQYMLWSWLIHCIEEIIVRTDPNRGPGRNFAFISGYRSEDLTLSQLRLEGTTAYSSWKLHCHLRNTRSSRSVLTTFCSSFWWLYWDPDCNRRGASFNNSNVNNFINLNRSSLPMKGHGPTRRSRKILRPSRNLWSGEPTHLIHCFGPYKCSTSTVRYTLVELMWYSPSR